MERTTRHTPGRWRPAACAAALAALAVLPAAGPSADGPPAATGPATPAEWAEALKVIRQVALDADRPSDQRANALTAFARMQLAKGRPADALKLCREVLTDPKERPTAAAAVEAGRFVVRRTRGHMGAEQDLLTEWASEVSNAVSKQALSAARSDLARTRVYLAGLTRIRPPGPIRPAMPSWGRPGAKQGPRVLRISLPQVKPPGGLTAKPPRGPGMLSGVKLPVYAPPRWYSRLKFPLLKKDKK